MAIPLSLWLLAAAGCDDGATQDAPQDAARDAAVTPTPDAAADAAADAGQFYPCDVEAVLRAKCHTCHTMPPRNGAPMSLLTWAKTQDLASGSATQTIWQRAREYVSTGYMPFAGSPTGPLTPAEKATLLGWLEAGALPVAQACSIDAGTTDSAISTD